MQTPQRSADPLHDAISRPSADQASFLAGPLTTVEGADDASSAPRPATPPGKAASLASAPTGGRGNLRASSSALGILVGILVVLAILAIL